MKSLNIKSILKLTLSAALVSPSTSFALTYDGKDSQQANQYIEQNLLDGLPFTFTIPESRQVQLTDRQMRKIERDRNNAMFQFRHSDSDKTGLRIYFANNKPRDRRGIIDSLQEKGLMKSGDVVLKFHPEWGYTGGYPTVMAGISHAGYIYEDRGKLYNADMPLNKSFNRDMRRENKPSALSSSVWQQEAHFVHILRPRASKMNDRAIKNAGKWAKELVDNMTRYYPSQICFNSNYMVPAYALNPNFSKDALASNISLFSEHSKELAYIAKRDRNIGTWLNPKTMGGDQRPQPTSQVCMFCSDFAWSISAIGSCDFNGRLGECNPKPLFLPIPVIGNGPMTGSSYQAGVSDLSYIILSQLGLDPRKAAQMVEDAFDKKKPFTNISSGHVAAAEQIPNQLYDALANYAKALLVGETAAADQLRDGISEQMPAPPNYSPNSFLVNAVLPDSNSNKAYDYVATVAFLDQRKVDKVKQLAPRTGAVVASESSSSASTPSASGARQVPASIAASVGRNLNRCIGTVNWGNGYVPAMGRLGYGDCQPLRIALQDAGEDWEQYVDEARRNN